ncbi:hypothetical protein ACQKLP_23810 [Chitinophaga sp. NPDC101104]|uniref:hypothetical protein n=1 Tax=Chitinophaga sp. NPDC101104 TaxID=3390561 RepID=UPI003D05830C
MPDFYMPSDATLGILQGLLQGFWIEKDKDGIVVILIKLEASLLNSIITGCILEVVLRNPHAKSRSCTLYVHDIPNNPFYVSWQEFSNPDPNLHDFDQIAIELARSSEVRVVLFNELTHPIFSVLLKTALPSYTLESWLFKVYNDELYRGIKNDPDGNYHPETPIIGFPIKILNQDHSSVEKLILISPEYEEEWREKWEQNKGVFHLKDFEGDGKHGYYQEFSIMNYLARFFAPEKEFFVGPVKSDGNEFTDFVICGSEAALLIESKYIISNKQTKRNSALSKAIEQLNKAEESILNGSLNLVDLELTKKLIGAKFITKICLVNDKTILSDTTDRNLLTKYSKKQLPLFISTTSFFQIVGTIKLQQNSRLVPSLLFSMYLNYKKYLISDSKICYIREFEIINSNNRSDIESPNDEI